MEAKTRGSVYGVGMTNAPVTDRLSHHERLELAVEACVHPRTVERLFRGEPIRSTTAARIKRAAQSLGITLPPLHIAGAAGAR
jgi:transcriptional regulator GlxA family with amidase domain